MDHPKLFPFTCEHNTDLPKCDLAPEASSAPGSLLEMQTFWPHPELLNQDLSAFELDLQAVFTHIKVGEEAVLFTKSHVR